MPIYLVRWPDLSASFVQAEGEAHLLDVLDQVGNPDDCEWSIYDGPLFIDFRLPVEWSVQEDRHRTPVAPEQVVLEDVGRLASGNVVEAIELSLADADDGYETGAEVLRLAFPKLHALIERCSETGGEFDGEAALPEAELRQALHAELERFLRGSWRRAKLEKKTDAISTLAREMDLSVELARTYEEIARNQQSGGRDAERPPQEKPSTTPPLFRISNHHTQDCGQPPAIDGDGAGKYVGYFANQYGEQAVFVYDYQTREASVWMGDTGWGKVHRVVDGRTEGIILTESEATWVRACWLAAAKGD
ncbi:MAG TPA: hypothetical protein VEK37_06555 [Gemmatimonadaceae bacterium]|nr:hypothetical protein [Gemmatimonadaceae bacterium]